ncbi:HAMP domain protein, partial [Vibrio parahaemolyticus VP-48]
RKPSRRAC